MSDKLTLMVFKDQFPARTFKIPRRWITQVSILVLITVALGFISTVLAFRYFRIASRLDPTRIQELEAQIQTLSKTAESRPAVTPGATPTVTLTSSASAGASLLFSAFPNAESALPSRENLPFKLTRPTTQWRGNMLQFKSAIQYSATDGGSQQGFIVILARGPESLLAYPVKVFEPTSSKFLIQPKKAESFSVSRYREIKAEFGPVKTRESLNEVQLLIFDADEKPILIETIKVEHLATPPPVQTTPVPVVTAPAAVAPEAAPSTQSPQNEIIQPGTDQ